jgi:Holliday junction resolvasome RuvABC endonuclease subunit
MKKFIRIIAAAMAAFFCLQIVAFAEGDPNIDNGGGGLKDGSSENFWNPGNDGVRVTIVDAETGAVKSASIDYTNTNASDIALHFGKVSKAEYVGGTALSATTSSYTFINPTEPLPTIISDGSGASIEEIRSYFTDEQVVKRIAEHTRIEFDDLTNGDYKLMVEPIMYITFNGIRTAMTATEAALYNMQTGGEMINKMGPLSHKNLPLAMFLEKDDLGYTAWTGSKNSYMTDSDIIQYLGVGIVSFKEPEEEVEVAASDYEYRVDTDVYTSITVTGGEHTPDNPVTVRFYIKNKVYTVGNIVYPKGASQLVWCKWHTPNTEQTVNIKVTVTGGASASKTNITANIVDLNKNPPPDPTADDRNDSFRAVSVPNREQRTSAAWSVWSAYWQPKWVWQSRWRWTGKRWVDRGRWVDKGEWKFRSNSYSVSMSANMQITCDEKNPTNVGRTMKSGYGINETVTASISGNGQHTELQNAVAYFPEFYYKTYWRLLEYTNGALEFRKNKYSTYNNRTHFTPLWYPDGNYKVYTWAIDCWTPAGMLSANLTDSLTIKGNVFDDWHIAPSH